MTVEDLLKQLEDEEKKSEAWVNTYQRNFNDCAKRGDYNSAISLDRKMRIEGANISRLNVAIDVIKERVT